jgi:hypothetical protein
MKRLPLCATRTVEQNLVEAERIAARRSPRIRRERAGAILARRRAMPPERIYDDRGALAAGKVKTSREYRAWATRAVDVTERMGLKALALALGYAWHKHVKPLAASSEAVVSYGRGGQEDSSRDYYSKSWHNSYGPKKWRNAGAQIVGLARRCVHATVTPALPAGGVAALSVELRTHLDKVAATISLKGLPNGWRKRKQGALLDGEILAVDRGTRVDRYNSSFRRTGVAIAMPTDLQGRFGKWEHGATVAACKAEIAAKRAVVERENAEKRQTHRQARRLHLVTVMCPNIRVTYQHARAAGLCDQGIRQYCAAHGLSVEEGAPSGVLRATRDARAQRAIEAAARDLLAARGAL